MLELAHGAALAHEAPHDVVVHRVVGEQDLHGHAPERGPHLLFRAVHAPHPAHRDEVLDGEATVDDPAYEWIGSAVSRERSTADRAEPRAREIGLL